MIVIPTPEPTPTPDNWWKEEVFKLTDEAGMSRADVECAIQHESGWNPNKISPVNKNGTIDKGLWQINSVHEQPDNVTLNPIRATQFSIKLWKDRGWGQWFGWATYCK